MFLSQALGDAAGAVADCSAALDLFETDEGGGRAAGPVPAVGTDKRRAWVLRTLARRGAALAKLGKLDDAVVDYETAVSISQGDAKLQADLDALRTKAEAQRTMPDFAAAPPVADGAAQADLD